MVSVRQFEQLKNPGKKLGINLYYQTNQLNKYGGENLTPFRNIGILDGKWKVMSSACFDEAVRAFLKGYALEYSEFANGDFGDLEGIEIEG